MAKRDEEQAAAPRTRRERTHGTTPTDPLSTGLPAAPLVKRVEQQTAVLAEIAALRAAHVESQAALLADLAAVRTELSALRTHINQQASLTRGHDSARLRGVSQQQRRLPDAVASPSPQGEADHVVSTRLPWWRRWLARAGL